MNGVTDLAQLGLINAGLEKKLIALHKSIGVEKKWRKQAENEVARLHGMMADLTNAPFDDPSWGRAMDAIGYEVEAATTKGAT